jgi:integrase/recombinase XerD
VGPFFDRRKPAAVTVALIREFVMQEIEEEANPASIRIYVALLSSLFEELVERGIVLVNPARGLPKSLVRLMKSTHDPRMTPFIEKLEDVRRIYLALPEPLDVAYALGALGGLRTGEVFALQWPQVDLARRRIHLCESIKGKLKDKDSRMVPILDPLLPILTAWKLRAGGEGRVVPSLRVDGKKIDKATPGKRLTEALAKLKLDRPGLGWYEATRHTFASQWVMEGGSIEKLKEILGHYSVVMTERYLHLRPELFTAADLGTIKMDLRPGAGIVTRLNGGEDSHRIPTAPTTVAATSLNQ